MEEFIKLPCLEETLEFERNVNKRKIVFTNGCFDILHAGHIKLFEFCAKKTCSENENKPFVIVGINSDLSIERLKGPGRPFNSQYDRLSIVRAIKYIDFVQVFDTVSVLPLVKLVEPDILVKGGDYDNIEDVVGSDFVLKKGGKVLFSPHIKNRSSSNFVKVERY